MQTDTSVAIRKGEELNITRLNDYFKAHVPEVGTVWNITQFPGGFSNLTYCLHTTTGEFVLRRPPFGANIKSAHDMGREYRVLSLLKNHYDRAPKPIVLCEDESVIGCSFYVMERLKGVILRAAQAPKLNFNTEQWQKMSVALIDNLVSIHSLDIYASGLLQLGKPEGYVHRQVEGWIKRYYNAETDKIDTLDEIAQWLPQNMPLENAPALLHNDYKYDNVVLNENDLSKIIGVLDWEMSTVGDPLMDLGASLAYWSEPTDTDEVKFFNLTWLPGNLTRQEVIARYAEKSGRDVSNMLFYYVFGLYKNAVIAQQIYARWKQGYTKDPRFGSLLPIIKGLGQKAQHALEKQKI